MFFDTLQQFELCFGAHEVVFRILNFIISIAVDIVRQEPYALHIGEEGGCVGQVLYLYRQQEGTERSAWY